MATPTPPDTPPADVPPWIRWAIYTVQQVGFPVAVAAYLLWAMQRTLDGLSLTIATNTQVLQRLLELHSR